MDGDNYTTALRSRYTIIRSCVIVDRDNSTTALGSGIRSCIIVDRDYSPTGLGGGYTMIRSWVIVDGDNSARGWGASVCLYAVTAVIAVRDLL